MEMKEDASQGLRFSKLQNHRVMADISIKAMERPTHQLWIDAGIYLGEWEQQLRYPNTFDRISSWVLERDLESEDYRMGDGSNPAEIAVNKLWAIENMRDFPGHFAQYLCVYWMRHCREVNAEVTQRIWNLIQNPSSGFHGWLLACAVFEFGLGGLSTHAKLALRLNEEKIFSPHPFLIMA